MNKAVARNDAAFKFWATLPAKRLALGVRTPGDRPLGAEWTSKSNPVVSYGQKEFITGRVVQHYPICRDPHRRIGP